MAENYNIYNKEVDTPNIHKDITEWASKYKEVNINAAHDRAALNLILPDDCLVFAGPPRLSQIKDASSYSDLYPIGFLQGFSYSETSQTQYLKALGSRRHIPSRTNAPVQGSIQRLLFIGDNLAKVLESANIQNTPSELMKGKFAAGTAIRTGQEELNTDDWWLTNIEEDLFRIPFGLGIIYNSPSSLARDSENDGSTYMANERRAEYIECCMLVNKQVGFQAGAAYVAEQVSFIGDRVVGWKQSATINSSGGIA